MSDDRDPRLGERILLIAPTRMDGEMTRSLLADASIDCDLCAGPDEARREIEAGCGGLLLTEDAILLDDYPRLVESLGDQPPWSDLPVVILTRGGADSPRAAEAIATLGNVIVLEQPVRVSTLVSALRMALRARHRQYQLREHLDGLKDAARRKDEFLAMLAHELRNPLASVNSAVHLLRRPDGPDHLEWSGKVLERQVRHLSRLIDDLLDISRITRGMIELRREVLDAAPILGHSVEAVRPLVEGRKHELTVSIGGRPLWVEADPTRLEQVVVNLLTNSAKYTESGGHIRLSAGREGDDIVVKVEDDGVGIPPDQLPRMFELFAQGDRSLARSEGGLGIGLTLVKALVEMHGGTIEASSGGPGLGSEFTVRLPAAPAPLRAEPESSRGQATARGLKILVVDDNVDTARGLAKLLGLIGHDVRVAHTGPDGVQAAREHRPEVVLLDIGLPGMDGYEVAAALRRDESTREALIIAVSGYGQDQDRARSKEAGFDHHLIKPVDYDLLLALLARPEPAA